MWMPRRSSSAVRPVASARWEVISAHSGPTGKSGCATTPAAVSYNSGRSSGIPAAYAINQR